MGLLSLGALTENREGRAALVTFHSCFQFMVLYSVTQAFVCFLLFLINSNMTDMQVSYETWTCNNLWQFMYDDIILAVPTAVFLAHTQTERHLVPQWPASRMISWRFLLSVVGLCILTVALTISVYLHLLMQPWYPAVAFPASQTEWTDPRGVENTVLFLILNFALVTNAVMAHGGLPFRRRIITNIPLTGLLVAGTAFNVALLMSKADSTLTEVFAIVPVPFEFRVTLLCYAFGHFVLAFLCETCLFPRLASMLASSSDNMSPPNSLRAV